MNKYVILSLIMRQKRLKKLLMLPRDFSFSFFRLIGTGNSIRTKSRYTAIFQIHVFIHTFQITDKHIFMITQKADNLFILNLQLDDIINDFSAGVPTINIIANEY